MAEHPAQPVQGDVEGVADLRRRGFRPERHADLLLGRPGRLQQQENQQLAGARRAHRLERRLAGYLDLEAAERRHPQRSGGQHRGRRRRHLGRQRCPGRAAGRPARRGGGAGGGGRGRGPAARRQRQGDQLLVAEPGAFEQQLASPRLCRAAGAARRGGRSSACCSGGGRWLLSSSRSRSAPPRRRNARSASPAAAATCPKRREVLDDAPAGVAAGMPLEAFRQPAAGAGQLAGFGNRPAPGRRWRGRSPRCGPARGRSPPCRRTKPGLREVAAAERRHRANGRRRP